MTCTIDYYFSPPSPWTYLGHDRFADMARRAGASIRLLPTDFGKVFAVSGGLPLGVQAVGACHNDARLLRSARWLVEEFIQRSRA